MNKTEIISLLKLLEDPDNNVYHILRKQILDNSELFKIYLENYHALSVNELAIERSEDLLDEIFLIGFEKQLETAINGRDSGLMDGAVVLEQYFNRDLDTEVLLNETENIVQSVWLEFNEQLTGIEKVKLIGKILFENQNFKKYPVGEFKPEYLSFANCVNYRKFVAPSISLLYCVIAERVSLPLYPLALPGLFLLSYVDEELADAVFDEEHNGAVFYIHPYDQGEFINHQLIDKYLKEHKIETKLEQIKNMSYLEYLTYFFEMRILALKHRKLEGFELRYADRVLKILKNSN
ncbi:MAG: hypothetical protein JXR36_01870 [Bacteroidales bacterium]|nr:hypothetical protein [Bacteroidales bacterium]